MLAYPAGIAAIRRIGASRGSLVGLLVGLLEVVSSALASWLLIGVVPTVVRGGGGVLLAGVALTQTGARPATAVEPGLIPRA